MTLTDHFEQLRRLAFERGMADFDRAKDNADPGEELWRNNPYQNNYATDEREMWDLGWDNAMEMDMETPQ